MHSIYNVIKADGVVTIAAALEQNTTLVELKLAFAKIGDIGATHLGLSLKKNRSLTTLILSSNLIGDPGAKSLSECLPKNAEIRYLYLNGNKITNNGAKHIANYIRFNFILKCIQLNDNYINELILDEFILAMRFRFTLIYFLMVDDPITLNIYRAIPHLLESHRKYSEKKQSIYIKAVLCLMNARFYNSTSFPLPWDTIQIILLHNNIFDQETTKKIIDHIRFILNERNKLPQEWRNRGIWLKLKRSHCSLPLSGNNTFVNIRSYANGSSCHFFRFTPPIVPVETGNDEELGHDEMLQYLPTNTWWNTCLQQ